MSDLKVLDLSIYEMTFQNSLGQRGGSLKMLYVPEKLILCTSGFTLY